MIANKSALVAVVVALAQQAQALNVHRHLHNEAEKRAIEIDWVTTEITVYVTAGQEPEPTAFVAAAKPVLELTSTTSTSTTSSLRPTTTSTKTSTIAAPITTTTSVAPPPPPPAPTTTLVSIAKAPVTEPETSAVLDVNVAPVDPVATTAEEPAAPTTTTTPAPTGGSDSGSGSSLTTKRGMAYNVAELANTFAKKCEKCSWAWSWGSSSVGLDESINFVPMLWGPEPDKTSYWDSDAEKALDNGAQVLMSFNECDNAGQCNTNATTAAGAHKKWMNKYADRAQIGAPSISNSGNPGEGIEWLEAFMAECNGECAVDFCPVHWYSEAQYSSTLFDHLEAARKACGGDKPIWLTEFAPIGGGDDISAFMDDVIPQLEKLDYLEAYSYFWVDLTSMMSSDTELSDFGSTYATM